MKYGLIGEKLGHSFSAEIHRLLSEEAYTLCPLAPDSLASFLTQKDFTGINVTIPYKEAVIPYLDEISPEAAAIGAVNTVVNRDGRLLGYNTDYFGILSSLTRMGISDLTGKKVFILGTGGTAHTAYAVLTALGAKPLYVSRTPKENILSYEQAATLHTDVYLIVNATPVGMYPENERSPISLAPFHRLKYVFDVVYNPLRTRLVQEAEARGIRAQGGLYMLVAQACAAASYFYGKTVPTQKIEEIFCRMEREKENLVLIGMPSSGKTSIGKALAQKTGRLFVDIDKEIVMREGTDITTIFAQKGEAYFREVEAAVAKEISKRSGCIIATGGGTVLNSESVQALKQNGVLLFLDRPLSALMPTKDRPTANTGEAIAARYRERLPVYRKAQDYTFPVGEDFSETVNAILKEFS